MLINSLNKCSYISHCNSDINISSLGKFKSNLTTQLIVGLFPQSLGKVVIFFKLSSGFPLIFNVLISNLI